MDDPVKQKILTYVKSLGRRRPNFPELVEIIRSSGVKDVRYFWELVDYANSTWSELNSFIPFDDLI